VIEEERMREELILSNEAPMLETGHTHIDTYETDAYGTTKPGMG